jgi:hypothetical protein
MTKPTPLINAAISAYFKETSDRRGIMAALRSACPKEPPSEWIEAMAQAAYENTVESILANWVVELSDHRREVWYENILASYRVQPLWGELYGDET